MVLEEILHTVSLYQVMTIRIISVLAVIEQQRADTILALLNLFILITYFSACLASKEPSMERLWCWRVPRVLVIGALVDVSVLYAS